MQRILQKIKDSRTTDALIKAVDEMHDDDECEKFRTTAARDVVVGKKHLITNNSASYAVARWIMFCSMITAGQKVCSTKSVYTTLMEHCWPNATTHNTRYYVVSAFTNITISITESRELWVAQGNGPADALIQVLEEEKDPNRVRWLANGIASLAKHAPALFNSQRSYDAYLKTVALPALSAECIQWIASSLGYILADNKEGRELFSKEEFLTEYKKLEAGAASDLDAHAAYDKTLGILEEAVAGEEDTSHLDPIQKIAAAKDARALSRALINFHDNKQESYRNAGTLDVILAKKDLLTTNAAAFALGQAVTWFAMVESGQLLAATPEVFDLLIKVAYSVATDHETRYWLVSAGPGNICISDFEARKVFAQPEAVKACLEVLAEEPTTVRIRWLANACFNLATGNPTLFCSTDAVDAFATAISRGKSAEAAEWICTALGAILVPSNETAKQFYGTPAFRDALKTLRDNAYESGATGKAAYDKVIAIVEQEAKNNDTAVRNLRLASTAAELTEALLYLHDKAGEEHRTVSVRDLLLVQHRDLLAASNDERLIYCYAKFFTWFSQKSEGRKLLLTARTDIYSFITNDLLARSGTSRDARYWCLSCVGNLLYSGSEAKTLFSTPEIVSFLLSLLSTETDPHRARWLATAVALLCSEERGRNLFTSTPELLQKTIATFTSVFPYATTPDAVEWCAAALSNATLNNRKAVELIANQEFRNVYSAMQRYATTKESRQDYERLLNLLDGEVRRKKVQSLLDLASRHARSIPVDAVDILVENDVDPSSLLILNAEALEEIGIGVVARLVLLDIINKERQNDGGASISSASASVSPNNNQIKTSASTANNAVSSQQLQQERDAHVKTCQERAELERKLHETEKEIISLRREVELSRVSDNKNQNTVLSLPFMREKMYYQFSADLTKSSVAVPSNSSIFHLVTSQFMKKSGGFVFNNNNSGKKGLHPILITRPVAGFSLEKVELITADNSLRQGFENYLASTSSSSTSASFVDEQNQLLLYFRDQFLPASNSGSKNFVNVFYSHPAAGAAASEERSALLLKRFADSTNTTSVNLEFAARNAAGEFGGASSTPSGLLPVLWCVAAVENASDDFTCSAVDHNNKRTNVNAEDAGFEYLNVEFNSKKNNVLPLAVLWLKEF